MHTTHPLDSTERPGKDTRQPSWRRIASLAAISVRHYLTHVRTGDIALRRDRLGHIVVVDEHGPYTIFRETVGNDGSAGEPTVLVVGFRLRVLHSNPLLHWMFQRVCLLTTPLWSGFEGFRVKLWMVAPESRDYLGIYQWAGEQHSRTYVTALARVLRALSTPGSVWYEVLPDQELEPYLRTRSRPTR
jgi:hypothetical protein